MKNLFQKAKITAAVLALLSGVACGSAIEIVSGTPKVGEQREAKNMIIRSIKKIDLHNKGSYRVVASVRAGYQDDSGVYLFSDDLKTGTKISKIGTGELEVSDVNGDGYEDIIATIERQAGYGSYGGPANHGFYILINNQDGTFSIQK